ncbi:NPC intracellular cholesterol transporter 2 homolog a-like, partial [Belonocnema kinseyi]|uniref:NPC intracellular cholesterol transporter 2 homolog a-like n=1 Tax=Belonocnema kinseyi TaxID=2817044 RepID=UPI00143D6F30
FADKNINNVNAVVTGIINGIRIPFPLPNPDGCTSLPCPLDQGVPYTYTASLPVSQMYPKISVEVEWALQNEHQQVIACVLIPAKIE